MCFMTEPHSYRHASIRLRNALLEGGILVILVLFLFVAEFRTALTVLSSLPITFLATFLSWDGPASRQT